MNWIKLSNSWVNLDNIVRIEIIDSPNGKTATMISVKPGGSDKTVLNCEDAVVIEKFFNQK